jgi:hypothetical protein
MHNFLNALIWAIITNRTLLWKYYDRTTCERVGKGHDRGICLNANFEQDCAEFLSRASWLPSYDDWSNRLNLTNIKKVTGTNVGIKTLNIEGHKSASEGSNNHSKFADEICDRIIEFPQMFGQDAKVLARGKMRNSLKSEYSKDRVYSLFHDASANFLYGFLFHETFQFEQSALKNDPIWWNGTQWNSVGLREIAIWNQSLVSELIVLHSRHSNPVDDGSKITWEKKCVKQILEGETAPIEQNASTKMVEEENHSCVLLILSDRQKTIDGLGRFMHDVYSYCKVIVASHSKGESWRSEHGDFAGIGFYQDLWLVQNLVKSHASAAAIGRLAFIGHKSGRSSSTLIRELIIYNSEKKKGNLVPSHAESPLRLTDKIHFSSQNVNGDILTCYSEDIESKLS